MKTLVMKFGGSAVGMTTGLTQVLSIVLYENEHWDRVLLVVSALEGVTDALIEAAHLAELNSRRGYRRIVATLRTRHLALIDHLPLGNNEKSALGADIDRLLFDMLDQCQLLSDSQLAEQRRMETIDAIIGVGERLAARIVAALLRQNGLRGVAVDATDLIITDNVYGNATPNMVLTRDKIEGMLMPMLDRKIIPVITGFIGSTPSGKPTTLGRGGSDYTASILSVCVNAEQVWIWTDVNGMMTADPRELSDARMIPSLTYNEAAELAYFGARILHARMIAPLRDFHIPLRVRNVFKPQGVGTHITGENTIIPPPLKAVTAIGGLGMSAPHSGSLARIASGVDEALFTLTGTHTDVMFTSQSASGSFVCFVIPTSAGSDALHSLQRALQESLGADGDGWTIRPVTVITVIGEAFGAFDLPFNGMILSVLRNVRALAISQGPSGCSFSVVVEPQDAESAMTLFHDRILADIAPTP